MLSSALLNQKPGAGPHGTGTGTGTGLTRRVDGVHGGHREARLDGAQCGDGVLRQIGQTDGHDVRLVELELGLQAHGKGGAGIAHLGKGVLPIGDHTHLENT